jgi:hypothetical protein
MYVTASGEEFPYTPREMAELCGVYYLYDDDHYPPGKRPQIEIIVHRYRKNFLLSLIVSCSLIDTMEIVFNFRSNNISINLLVSSGEEKDIAARVMNFMRVRARKEGFQLVTLKAHKSDKPLILPKFPYKRYFWSGYITWGKVGFLFLDDKDRKKFLDMVKNYEDYNSEMTMLHHLLATQKGTNYWVTEGYKWEGFYDFTNPTCNEILTNYLQRKGLRYA